jgi:hypothetical protein
MRLLAVGKRSSAARTFIIGRGYLSDGPLLGDSGADSDRLSLTAKRASPDRRKPTRCSPSADGEAVVRNFFELPDAVIPWTAPKEAVH